MHVPHRNNTPAIPSNRPDHGNMASVEKSICKPALLSIVEPVVGNIDAIAFKHFLSSGEIKSAFFQGFFALGRIKLDIHRQPPITSVRNDGLLCRLHRTISTRLGESVTTKIEKSILAYSAASSAASPRSTLTRRETPFSAIVTPNRRCIRLIVTALWVTIR